MGKIKIFVVLLFCCMFLNILTAFADANNNTSSYARKYTLGPNDILSIKVYNNSEFDQENIRVNPDGKIVLTPLGSIKVDGLTIDNLKELLTQKFKYYLNDPQITINLEESRPFVVYITGAVLSPGSYELITSSRYSQNSQQSTNNLQINRMSPLLSNVLVAAGGITYDADLEHIKITNSKENTSYELNLLDLLENGNFGQDIYLIPGDNVSVPKLPTPLAVNEEKYRKFASATFSQKEIPIKVYGYVNRPGLISLDPAKSFSLNSAIMSAGGYLNDSAYAPKLVYISRQDTSGKLVTKAINPMSNDVTLLPNDIVYIPEKTRPLIGKAFDYMTRVLSPVNNAANIYNDWALMFNPTRYQVIGK